LALVGQAKSNYEIARTLSISEGTVKRHLSNIYAKLGATSRVDAVRKATSAGLMGHALDQSGRSRH
jgi:DNA-binding CsgD family transcriptional regulator